MEILSTLYIYTVQQISSLTGRQWCQPIIYIVIFSLWVTDKIILIYYAKQNRNNVLEESNPTDLNILDLILIYIRYIQQNQI